MNPRIQKTLIRALKSEQWLLDFSPGAPLCRVMPNGDHVFSPTGVLCDLAPKEVCDWEEPNLFHVKCASWFRMLPNEVEVWAGLPCWPKPPMNGYGTLEATIKAIEKL